MADYLGKQPTRSDGIYDAATNEQPSSTSVTASERNAAIGENTINKRVTAKPGDENKIAMDVALSDGNGDSINKDNPLYVTVTESPGAEIEDYHFINVTADGGFENHDYTTGGEFRGINAQGSSAGLAKFELQVETAPASNTFETKQVRFNSVSQANVEFKWDRPKSIPSGVRIRMVKTNLEKNQDNDIYSFINGVEV